MEQDKDLNKENDPMQHKDEVQKSNDEHIDMDFPGYPNSQSKENLINPKNDEDKKSADTRLNENAEEDSTYPEPKNRSKKVTENDNEVDSDGSAGAFGGTEEVSE